MWASETKFDLKSDGAPICSGKVTFDDLMDVTWSARADYIATTVKLIKRLKKHDE
jgi:hypothetical protein